MKKFAIFFVAIALLVLGISELEAAPWRYYCVADSAAAETTDTFTVDVSAYSQGFEAIGVARMTMTGATDGAFTFYGAFDSDNTSVKSDYWGEALESLKTGDGAGQTTLAPANNVRSFLLAPHLSANNQAGSLETIIPGKKLVIIYNKGTVTGGTYSLYIWIRVLD